jgi:phosphoglycolate phosphatase-like HAD superfamily hydrolase
MSVADDDVEGHLPGILAELEAQLADAADHLRDGGRALPGVPELLKRLAAEPSVLQTTLTGNVAANAVAKLAAFGLDPYLDLEVGAFGSDHHVRAELVPIAVERVRRMRHLQPDVVWVIGDTEHDLACARAGGARCLLVGTGPMSSRVLLGAGADAAVEDLSDVDAVMKLLLAP